MVSIHLRPQHETMPVIIFDGCSWQGMTSWRNEEETAMVDVGSQADARATKTVKAGHVTRLRARQQKSPEPPQTQWEEMTWLVASLRDMVAKQNHTMDEIRASQKRLEEQNERIRQQNEELRAQNEALKNENETRGAWRRKPS